jgi:hypothetical protein
MLYQKRGYHQHHLHPSSIHPLVVSSPPSSGVNPCTLISYLYSTLPPLLPYTYITLLLCSHFTYTSLFLIYHSSSHSSYERFYSLILISAHCLIQTPPRIILSAITLQYRCTPPPNMYCKNHISSCSLFTPLRTRRHVKGYNGTWHKYYHPNDNRQ